MSRQDLWLGLTILLSLATGVVWPRPAAQLAPAMPYILMGFLLLAFLKVEPRQVWRDLQEYPRRLTLLIVIKLVLLPLVVYPLVTCLVPEYALGALMLAGVSTGLSAPFFTALVGGDIAFTLVMTVATTLLLPLSLPIMVALLAGEALPVGLGHLVGVMVGLIFEPLAAAGVLRRTLPGAAAWLEAQRFPLSLGLLAGLNLGAAGQYAPLVLANLGHLAVATLLATLLAAVGTLSGALVFRRAPVETQTAASGACGWINNALVIVLGSYLGSPLAALLATLYLVPFYGLIWPLNRLRRRTRPGGGAPGL